MALAILLGAVALALVLLVVLQTQKGDDTVIVGETVEGETITRPFDPDDVPLDTGVIQIQNMFTLQNKFAVYHKLRAPKGFTVYLFYQPYKDFNGYPSFDQGTQYKSTSDKKTFTDFEFTHFSIFKTNPEVEGYDIRNPDTRCNRMRLAVEREPWPSDCLPQELQDRCGYPYLGYRVGSYQGLPTACNNAVGNVLDHQGNGVYANPIADIRSNNPNPEWRYPMYAPLFVTTEAEGNYVTPQRRSHSADDCERVWLCNINSKTELDAFQADVKSVGDGETDFQTVKNRYKCQMHNKSEACE